MTITAYAHSRSGDMTTVTVTSDLVGSGTVYYHWYLDGLHVAQTQSNRYAFVLPEADQARVEVLDTLDADYDYVANAPAGWPARRHLWWCRSLDADTAHYRVEQNREAAGWETIAIVHHQEDQWTYSIVTDRLDDLTSYQWRVVPVDQAGNDGTAATLAAETIVRTPDAPDFDISFDSGTTRVTFSQAA